MITLCTSRNGILLTNDKYVKSHCILKPEKMKKLIDDIEKSDRTTIKAKDDILKD